MFAGTAAPVDLWAARVQIRALFGRLTQTAYSPQTGFAQVRAASGVVLVLEPRWPKGLELGATRFAHRPWRGWKRALNEVSTALRFGVRYKDVLARTAQDRYDWTSVGEKLRRELDRAAHGRKVAGAA